MIAQPPEKSSCNEVKSEHVQQGDVVTDERREAVLPKFLVIIDKIDDKQGLFDVAWGDGLGGEGAERTHYRYLGRYLVTLTYRHSVDCCVCG